MQTHEPIPMRDIPIFSTARQTDENAHIIILIIPSHMTQMLFSFS